MTDKLTDIDHALADADALQILAALRQSNPRGFHELTRAAARIIRRVVTGDATQPARYPSTADFVINALIHGYGREVATLRGVTHDLTAPYGYATDTNATDRGNAR